MKEITQSTKEMLKQIGFDRAEICTFCSLLGKGLSSVQDIAKDCKLPRSSIHLAVESLLRRGVVSVSKYGKRRLFFLESPDRVLQFLNYEEKAFLAKKTLAQQLLPELKAYSALLRDEEPIEITELAGEDGFVKTFYSSLEGKHKEVLRLGGNPEKFTVARDKLADYRRLRTKKGIISKILMPDGPLTEEEKVDAIGKQREVRSLPAEIYNPEVVTSIFGDTVTFTVWDKGLHTVKIKNSRITDLLKSLYQIAWKQAK